jgi:CheY-like chemotaxis protein
LTSLTVQGPVPLPETGSNAGVALHPAILIADDHDFYRKTLKRWFGDHGFTVWAAADGHQAVELYREHAKDILLALLDVRMPGLDGPGTLAALRREAPAIPCCFMTANLDDALEAQLRAAGAARVFTKPLVLREVTAVIRELIQDSQGQGEP